MIRDDYFKNNNNNQVMMSEQRLVKHGREMLQCDKMEFICIQTPTR